MHLPLLNFSLAELKLPLTDPVHIYTLLLPIILLAPILLRKLRIPGIVGLIIAGVAIGEHGLNLVPRSSISLLGNMGLLYIMFLAGLDMDLNEFRKTKYKSIGFGILTFAIPLSLGLWVCQDFLGFGFREALLVSCMFATHTLVSYPIASRLGITKNISVAVAIGGTIITDTAVLVLLSVITGHAQGELDMQFWIFMILSFTGMTLAIIWGFPILTRWFFKRVQGEKTSQFVFVLALLYLAGFLSQVAGLEPIIGAFMAGLALNRLIPHGSQLMNRVDFVGNALFIPFFLISTGMLVDLRVLFQGTEAIIVAAVLTGATLVGKYAAAWGTQVLFGFSANQRNLIFGLSASHAAATLAVILTGHRLGLVNEAVLNGTIILILVTCLTSSFVTEVAGRKIAIDEAEAKPELDEQPERVLVPVASPGTLERLLETAMSLRDRSSPHPLYPMCVVDDNAEASENVLHSARMMGLAVDLAMASEVPAHPITRVDLNVAAGISRVAKELLATELVLGWTDKMKTSDRIFGSTLESILQNTWQSIWVTRLTQPLNTVKKVVVLLPENAGYEPGFPRLLTRMARMAEQTSGRKLVFCTTEKTWTQVEKQMGKLRLKTPHSFVPFTDWEQFGDLTQQVQADDLLIVVSARKGTVSYHNHLDTLPGQLSRTFAYNSFIVCFPMQVAGATATEGMMQAEDLAMSPIQENLQRFQRLRRKLRGMFSRKPGGKEPPTA